MKISKNNLTKIIHGDIEEALDSQIEDSSVDLIFADLTYNIGKKILMATKCNHIDHVNTQLPYAIIDGLISIILFMGTSFFYNLIKQAGLNATRLNGYSYD